MATLDKYYEADSIAVASGDPLVAGSDTKDYTIPDGEEWTINEFGGSSSIDSTEVELLWTDDGGSTWSNPYDSSTTKLRCLHLNSGNVAKVIDMNLKFEGDGTNTKIRLNFKNWNQVNTAEVSGWLNGVIE